MGKTTYLTKTCLLRKNVLTAGAHGLFYLSQINFKYLCGIYFIFIFQALCGVHDEVAKEGQTEVSLKTVFYIMYGYDLQTLN